MVAFNKFQQFVEDIAHGEHDLAVDTLKIALVASGSAPVATNTVLANLTQIATGNGYNAGGTAASITSSGHTTGTYKLVLGDVVFTASGGTIPSNSPTTEIRYAALYNDTSTAPADPLIGWWDYGSAVTLADTETFTVDFDPTNGVLTIA